MDNKRLTGTATEIRKLVGCLWHMGSDKIYLVDGGTHELLQMFRATWLELRQALRGLPSSGIANLKVTQAQHALIHQALKMYQQYLKASLKRTQKHYNNALKNPNTKSTKAAVSKTKKGLFD